MAKDDLVIDRDVNSWKVSLTKLDGIPEGAVKTVKDFRTTWQIYRLA